MSEIQTLYVGQHKDHGRDVVLEWTAELVPFWECDGGGWYLISKTKKTWLFSYKAAHKTSWSTTRPFHDEPLDVQLKRAVEQTFRRFCDPNKS